MLCLCNLICLRRPPYMSRPMLGETTKQMLKRLYAAHKTYDYTRSKVILYNEVECENDRIELVYVSNDYNWRCHQTVSVSAVDVNAEHVVPQSVFAQKLPMKSDLHHLFACPSKINNKRGNYPYTEVDYNQCKYWCNANQCQTNKPSNPSNYSCITPDNKFMPLDQDKGRVARAIFYFYTMYDQYDINAKFDVSLLKRWNNRFPPNSFEIRRNNRVNQTQGNRNPYIDDFTLVDKAF